MNSDCSIVKCGKGWETIYQPIIDAVIEHDNLQDNIEDKIGIKAIKEDFGVMIVYFVNPKNVTKQISDLVTKSVRESIKTCEYCGSKDEVGITLNHKIKTCCKECWENRILIKNSESIWKNLNTNQMFKNNKK